ncbi:hypothetical protein [Streptomyces mirabilis]|uniref:hypothetical protein n=1 Tax=Streptomyces mirabilis TaxID=68239 RepID=UPI0036D03898
MRSVLNERRWGGAQALAACAFEARLDLGDVRRFDGSHGEGQATELVELVCAGRIRVLDQGRFVSDGAEEVVEARVELGAGDANAPDGFEERIPFPFRAVVEGHAREW